MGVWKPSVALLLLCVFALLKVNGNPKLIKEQEILKKILNENVYDKMIRAYGTNAQDPTNVTVNMYVRDIEKLDDINKELKVQLTFRMEWLDTRLKYEPVETSAYKLNYLTLDGRSATKIWIPDLFFTNSREAHKHDTLVPNEYVRISPDGTVLHSQRITLTLSCATSPKKLPWDQELCSIRMASYGWTTEDLIFHWKGTDPVKVTSEINLPKFALGNFRTDNCDSVTTTGTYSCIRVDFMFKRESCQAMA